MLKLYQGLIGTLAVVWHPTGGTQCIPFKVSQIKGSDNSGINRSYIEELCPSSKDPPNFTHCCQNMECCTIETYQTEQMEDKIVMMISLSVIIACLLLASILIVCCFWSKCLFYNTCRPNYNSSDVIVYSLAEDDGPLKLMPNDECLSTKVKIRKVEEV